MDINIAKSFFKVWFKVDQMIRGIPGVSGSPTYKVDIDPYDGLPFGLTLPTCVLNGRRWSAVGYGPTRHTSTPILAPNPERELIGLDGTGPTIKIMPITDNDDCSYWNTCLTSLTSPVRGYCVVFLPVSDSVSHDGNYIYYTIIIKGPHGEEMPLKFTVGECLTDHELSWPEVDVHAMFTKRQKKILV